MGSGFFQYLASNPHLHSSCHSVAQNTEAKRKKGIGTNCKTSGTSTITSRSSCLINLTTRVSLPLYNKIIFQLSPLKAASSLQSKEHELGAPPSHQFEGRIARWGGKTRKVIKKKRMKSNDVNIVGVLRQKDSDHPENVSQISVYEEGTARHHQTLTPIMTTYPSKLLQDRPLHVPFKQL